MVLTRAIVLIAILLWTSNAGTVKPVGAVWDPNLSSFVGNNNFCDCGFGSSCNLICAGGGSTGNGPCSPDACTSGQYTFSYPDGWAIRLNRPDTRAFAYAFLCGKGLSNTQCLPPSSVFTLSVRFTKLVSLINKIKILSFGEGRNTLLSLFPNADPKQTGLALFPLSDTSDNSNGYVRVKDGVWYDITVKIFRQNEHTWQTIEVVEDLPTGPVTHSASGTVSSVAAPLQIGAYSKTLDYAPEFVLNIKNLCTGSPSQCVWAPYEDKSKEMVGEALWNGLFSPFAGNDDFCKCKYGSESCKLVCVGASNGIPCSEKACTSGQHTFSKDTWTIRLNQPGPNYVGSFIPLCGPNIPNTHCLKANTWYMFTLSLRFTNPSALSDYTRLLSFGEGRNSILGLKKGKLLMMPHNWFKEYEGVAGSLELEDGKWYDIGMAIYPHDNGPAGVSIRISENLPSGLNVLDSGSNSVDRFLGPLEFGLSTKGPLPGFALEIKNLCLGGINECQGIFKKDAPAPKSSVDCSAVKHAHDPENPFWVELYSPIKAGVKVKCSGRSTPLTCTFFDGMDKLECPPNSNEPCNHPRSVEFPDGQVCPLPVTSFSLTPPADARATIEEEEEQEDEGEEEERQANEDEGEHDDEEADSAVGDNTGANTAQATSANSSSFPPFAIALLVCGGVLTIMIVVSTAMLSKTYSKVYV